LLTGFCDADVAWWRKGKRGGKWKEEETVGGKKGEKKCAVRKGERNHASIALKIQHTFKIIVENE